MLSAHLDFLVTQVLDFLVTQVLAFLAIQDFQESVATREAMVQMEHQASADILVFQDTQAQLVQQAHLGFLDTVGIQDLVFLAFLATVELPAQMQQL